MSSSAERDQYYNTRVRTVDCQSEAGKWKKKRLVDKAIADIPDLSLRESFRGC